MVVERITLFGRMMLFLHSIRKKNHVLITGHGNSLRALVKYLENVPEEEVDKSMSPMQSQSFIPLIHSCFYKNGWDKDEHYY